MSQQITKVAKPVCINPLFGNSPLRKPEACSFPVRVPGETPIGTQSFGFDPHDYLDNAAFWGKDPDDTPHQMALDVIFYIKRMNVIYFDCAGNGYISSFRKENGVYNIHPTIIVNLKNGTQNIVNTPGLILENIGEHGSSEDDAIEAVARYCAILEIDRLAEVGKPKKQPENNNAPPAIHQHPSS
jgi:hypothetical protein